jgi:hypothetical protein
MNKYNTILGQILVSRVRFESLVKVYKIEHGAKGLKSRTHFVAMIFGQLSGQHALRSIETGMNSQRHSFYHLGIPDRDMSNAKEHVLIY